MSDEEKSKTEKVLKSKHNITSSPCEQPNQQNTQKMRPELKMLFKRRAIRLNDLKYCKLFGLCLMCVKDSQCCSNECNENLSQQNQGIHKHRHYHIGIYT